MTNRREFLAGSVAIGGISVLPFPLAAAAHGGDVFQSPAGEFTVFPISHASLI